MRRGTATALATLLLATGCSGTDEPGTGPTRQSSSSAPETPEETPPEQTPSQTQPEPPEPLDWRPTGHSVDERVVVGEKWTAIATETLVRLEPASGDGKDVVLRPRGSGTVFAVLLEGDTAVVPIAFGGETVLGQGYRIDLTTGERTEIVTPEPANGGDWAMVDDSLYYPALAEGESVCLATLAVTDGNGEEGWCPDGRVGMTELDANEHGVALMLFDYGTNTSCRTLAVLDQTGVPQSLEGPTECAGWDVGATGTGVIWSEVPGPERQEVAVFHALVDGEPQELGPGTTGSLTSCGGDSFFVRDPASASDPARLMRWDGTELTVAYESTSTGNAFLGRPECADGILTISSFGEGGDEQVSASVS